MSHTFISPFSFLIPMRFKAKKIYGKSEILPCPFCHRQATQKNGQGLDVCSRHTKEYLADVKCVCEALLELRQGNYGPYFNCLRCGNINFKKAMEIHASVKPVQSSNIREQQGLKPKEITISSNDVEYFD